MKFGSLFSGIGGLDLGLERAGMTCVWQSEIEPYACRVLAKHWPHIPNLGDICGIDWTRVDRVDLVVGGYPCQPFSYAGVRRGEDDPRHLWPMFADCLRVVRPRYALMENVTGHLSLGFGSVLADLAALGYDAQWDCVPAAAVGAPHLRDRLFVIATRRSVVANSNDEGQGQRRSQPQRWQEPWHGRQVMADTGHERLEELRVSACGDESRQPASGPNETKRSEGRRWPPEPELGRVAHGIPRRMDRLRGLGNAVVPQVAEHLGNIIMGMEQNNDIEK